MIYEVDAAVQHIVSLILKVDRDHPLASEALAAFASTLKDALETRCRKHWNPDQPDVGSALRSVAWQLHPAGEGADLDLLRAFAAVVHANAQDTQLLAPHHSTVVALALQWLPISFTLWIDPGCVAIRPGSGPGANRCSYDLDLLKSAHVSSSLYLVWANMSAQSAQPALPQLTISTVAPARPIPILKPAPLSAHTRYPANLFTHARTALAPLAAPTAPTAPRHSRASSTASSTSSSSTGLVRSVSLSSTHTASTDATSLSDLHALSDADADADAETEACPSLCSPSSSLASTQCTPNSQPQCESELDTTLRADTTQRFAGVRLFDDDQDQEAGDLTIDASPMLGLNVSKHAPSRSLGSSFTTATHLPCSTPIKANYTTHDNGNVGVLGGGVRLGGNASAKNNTSSSQPPRHRQHSNSKSVSHLQGGLHHQLMPACMPRRLEQRMAHRMPQPLPPTHAANYSAPMPTVALPHVSQQQHYPPRYAVQQHQPYVQHYSAPQARRPVAGMMPLGAPSQLPIPYGFGAPAQQQPYMHYAGQQLQLQQQQAMPMVLDADDAFTAGRRRLRSRGRRSRGRGAGRAARRHAAALRALELGSTDELPEFNIDDGDDDDDDDEDADLLSRCSTPATCSDYTSSSLSSSVYSSTACSPAKLGAAAVSHCASKRKLGAAPNHGANAEVEFGHELHSNLARLHGIDCVAPLSAC